MRAKLTCFGISAYSRYDSEEDGDDDDDTV